MAQRNTGKGYYALLGVEVGNLLRLGKGTLRAAFGKLYHIAKYIYSNSQDLLHDFLSKNLTRSNLTSAIPSPLCLLPVGTYLPKVSRYGRFYASVPTRYL